MSDAPAPPTTYGVTGESTAIPTKAAPAAAAEPQPDDSGASPTLRLPSFIVTPIEATLGTLGKLAEGASKIFGDRGSRAASRARPWLEFFDLSAFKRPTEPGFSPFLTRFRINATYFLFNYVILGLVLTVLSVITKPIALIAAAILIWIYFQFFGSETAEDEFRFFGFSLDNHEKIGFMVVLGFLLFWLTAGGFEVFFSVVTASIFAAVIHGCLRKPSPDALASHEESNDASTVV